MNVFARSCVVAAVVGVRRSVRALGTVRCAPGVRGESASPRRRATRSHDEQGALSPSPSPLLLLLPLPLPLPLPLRLQLPSQLLLPRRLLLPLPLRLPLASLLPLPLPLPLQLQPALRE